jgi:hypothetical protein
MREKTSVVVTGLRPTDQTNFDQIFIFRIPVEEGTNVTVCTAWFNITKALHLARILYVSYDHHNKQGLFL